MTTLIDWYHKHSGLTHSVAAGIAVLVGAYDQVPAFHDLVNSYYGHLPAATKEITTTLAALYMWYRNGQKSQ